MKNELYEIIKSGYSYNKGEIVAIVDESDMFYTVKVLTNTTLTESLTIGSYWTEEKDVDFLSILQKI